MNHFGDKAIFEKERKKGSEREKMKQNENKEGK
jgi:hypothetical protein